MRSAGSVVVATCPSVARVPGVRNKRLPLHGVMPKCEATLDPVGVHLLEDRPSAARLFAATGPVLLRGSIVNRTNFFFV